MFYFVDVFLFSVVISKQKNFRECCSSTPISSSKKNKNF